jgi:exopolysaccharide biosynthesis protein
MFVISQKHGITDLIKLDGGGSFILDINGKNIAVTNENRRVNNLITFNE